MERTVTLNIEDKDMEYVATVTGRQAVWAAIGRLSVWGMQYPHADIFLALDRNMVEREDGGIELRASYRDKPGFSEPVKYFIAAIWHDADGAFGFHS